MRRRNRLDSPRRAVPAYPHAVTRRAIPLTIVTLAGLLLTSSAAPGAPGVASGDSSYRSDAWIKLCGQSTGCVIDPLPHPWLGKDVYNTTGRRQTVAVDVNEGEDVRFWITVENDGAETDTLAVQGCDGTRYFEVRHVVLGKQKRPNAAATEVTRKFKDGTLTFDLDAGKTAVFTLLVVTHLEKNITYECLMTVHSVNEPTSQDRVVAEMTTF